MVDIKKIDEIYQTIGSLATKAKNSIKKANKKIEKGNILRSEGWKSYGENIINNSIEYKLQALELNNQIIKLLKEVENNF